MGWVLKNLLRLLLLAVVVFAVWAFFADLPPPTKSRSISLPPPPPSAPAPEQSETSGN